jgi:hypothetical protein
MWTFQILATLIHIIAIALELNYTLPPPWILHVMALTMQLMAALLDIPIINRILKSILLIYIKNPIFQYYEKIKKDRGQVNNF